MRRDLHGVLCLDKPAGMTSFAAVQAARRLLGARKAGHAGTLDPMATGVLLVCFGEATKLTPFLVEHEKTYRATIALGSETDTEDAEGAVIATGDAGHVDRAAFEAAASRLVGRIEQRVPAYSAVRVGGERLYEKARRGEVVEAPVREVEVMAIETVAFAPPLVTVDVTCGRGTYVRAIATEIGRRLGCRAHLAALRRLRIGAFDLESATTLERLGAGETPRLVGLREALGDVPELRLDAALAERLARGGRPPPRRPEGPEGPWAACAPDGSLVALLKLCHDRWETLRVFRIPICIPSRMEGGSADSSAAAPPGAASEGREQERCRSTPRRSRK